MRKGHIQAPASGSGVHTCIHITVWKVPHSSHIRFSFPCPFLATILSLHWEKLLWEPDALDFLLSHPPNYNQTSNNCQGNTKVKPQVLRRGHLLHSNSDSTGLWEDEIDAGFSHYVLAIGQRPHKTPQCCRESYLEFKSGQNFLHYLFSS